VIVIVPVCVPVAAGVNVTLMVQFVPAATDVSQVLVCAYCVLAVMLVMLNAALPALLSVMTCPALVVPTSWVANVRLVGEKLTPALPPPLPPSLYAVMISIVVMGELKVGL
jgi:hypothetical protein